MLLTIRRLLQQKRARFIALSAAASLFALFLLVHLNPLELTSLPQPPLPDTSKPPPPQAQPPSNHPLPPTSQPPSHDLALPEYDRSPSHDAICTERFSTEYLYDFSNHSVSYCSPDSSSEITCFHTHKRTDGKADSMCFGRGVSFDKSKGKFSMECGIRELEEDEVNNGLVPFARIQSYWYDTGPPRIFSLAVDIKNPASIKARQDEEAEVFEEAAQEVEDDGSTSSEEAQTEAVVGASVEASVESSVEASVGAAVESSVDAAQLPPRNFLLLKREGESNLWHCMMEIMSAWMSFDVLRITEDPSTSAPFFQVPNDVAATQVVIADERGDGPYYDLWTLFAQRKPLRLKELAAQPDMVEAIKDANIIVPLAGSSNPLWQEDWDPADCSMMPILTTFARRVLDFYQIPEPDVSNRVNAPIIVTFIDRTETRRLVDQSTIFEELRKRIPHIELRVVDFGAIPFAEQLQYVRETDVLVGVHGAGLTHGLFMREHKGVMVEIQPGNMNYHVFRNIALLQGVSYYRVHGKEITKKRDVEELDGGKLGKRDWHEHDVSIEADRFIDVVETAVKSLYGNGAWDYDVN